MTDQPHIWYEYNSNIPVQLLWIPSPIENDPTRMWAVLVSEEFWGHLIEIGYLDESKP